MRVRIQLHFVGQISYLTEINNYYAYSSELHINNIVNMHITNEECTACRKLLFIW